MANQTNVLQTQKVSTGDLLDSLITLNPGSSAKRSNLVDGWFEVQIELAAGNAGSIKFDPTPGAAAVGANQMPYLVGQKLSFLCQGRFRAIQSVALDSFIITY